MKVGLHKPLFPAAPLHPSIWLAANPIRSESNDPRAIALAMAIDQGLAIWPISPARTNMILGYQYRLSVEAEEKAIECLEPWSEDWRTLMDELEARDRALSPSFPQALLSSH